MGKHLWLKPVLFLCLIALVLIGLIGLIIWITAISENSVSTVGDMVGPQTVLPFYATRTVQDATAYADATIQASPPQINPNIKVFNRLLNGTVGVPAVPPDPAPHTYTETYNVYQEARDYVLTNMPPIIDLKQPYEVNNKVGEYIGTSIQNVYSFNKYLQSIDITNTSGITLTKNMEVVVVPVVGTFKVPPELHLAESTVNVLAVVFAYPSGNVLMYLLYNDASVKYQIQPTPLPTTEIKGLPAIKPHVAPPAGADANTVAHTPTFTANDAKRFILSNGIMIDPNCRKYCLGLGSNRDVIKVEFLTVRDFIAKYGVSLDINVWNNPDRLICFATVISKFQPPHLQATTPPPVEDYYFYLIYDAHTGNQLDVSLQPV